MYDQVSWTGLPPTQVVKRKGEYLFGVAPCLAALQAKRRRVHAIFLKQGGEVNKKRQIKKQVRAIVTNNRMLTLLLVSQSQTILFLCESLTLRESGSARLPWYLSYYCNPILVSRGISVMGKQWNLSNVHGLQCDQKNMSRLVGFISPEKTNSSKFGLVQVK